jgi:hypothetical protein
MPPPPEKCVAIHNYKYASKLTMASLLANDMIYLSIIKPVKSFQTQMQGQMPEIITKISLWLNLMCVCITCLRIQEWHSEPPLDT